MAPLNDSLLPTLDSLIVLLRATRRVKSVFERRR